ncbi:MAG: CARDB domain-containing protein [Haloarcula sp.]
MFEDVDGPEQKTLLRLLIIVGIGLPILIEVATFGSMLGHQLSGDAGGETAAGTPTAEPSGASVGDTILDGSDLTVKIERTTVVTADDGWRFTLTVNVTNTGNRTATARLDSVTTQSGTTVEGSAATGHLSPGETGTVTKSWLLPPGERPATVSVTVLWNPGTGSPESSHYTVELGDIPVSNE